jgi:iron complex outermembrane receptor protein
MRNRNGVLALSRVGEEGNGGIALRRYDFEYGLPWRVAPVDGVRLRGVRNELTARGEHAGRGPFTQLRVDGTAQWYEHDEVLADGQVATALAVRTQQGQLLARTRAVGALRDGAVGVSVLARQHGVRGSQALTPPNANSSIAAFAFQELVPGRPGATGWRGVRLPVALRVDRVVTTTEATSAFGPAVSRRFTNLSASAGLTVPLRRDASFALNLAQAARVPSPEELFSRAGHAGTGAFEIGNPSLDAEVTRGVDAVLRIERRGLRVQLAAFRSLVDGWVGLYPSGRDTVVPTPGLPDKVLPLFTIAQRDARIVGGEATMEGAVARHLIVHGTADVLRATEIDGGALPFMPPGRVGGGARWDDGRWQLGGAVRHVFAQRRVSTDELPTEPVTLVEAHAGVRLVTGARVQSVMLRVENLGDRLYRDATSRIKDFAPAAGRNVSLLYRVTF